MSAVVPLVLALAVGPAEAVETTQAGLSLQADTIVVDESMVVGEGAVRATLLGGEILAERFELRLDGSGALIEEGCWVRSGERACFETLELLADGRLKLDRAELTLCSCEGAVQPWSVRALKVTVDPDRSAVFVGGWLRVAGCPLLPIPAGLFPLGPRRSGLLAPDAGWTPDGLELAQPLYLTLGPAADWTLTPSWRQQRGFRLGNELRWALRDGGRGELRALGGWDALDQRWRGMGDVEHGWVDRSLRTAASGSLASDLDYRGDFEADFTRRQQGFHELRALVGLGPVRMDHDGFQGEDPRAQRLLGLHYERPSVDAGPWSPRAALDLSLGGYGPNRMELDSAWLGAGAQAGIVTGRPLGPLEAEAELTGSGWLAQPLQPGTWERAGDPALEARGLAEARLALPLWADHRALRHLLRPSLVVGTSLQAEGEGFEVDTTLPRLDSLPGWWAGPRVESRWLSSTAVPLSLRAELPWTEDGLAPHVQAWWSSGPWWGSVLGSASWRPGADPSDALAWVEGGRRSEALRVSLGFAALQELREVDQLTGRLAWRLPLGADRWEPRARARWSLADAAFLERHLGLYFASRCDCLGVELGATWSEDRAWPDLGLRLDLGR